MLILRILLLCYWQYCTRAFPPEWVQSVVQLCDEFEKHPSCLFPGSCTLQMSMQTPLSHLVPQVLLWSPQEQLHIILHCPKCSTCQNLWPSGWRDGSTDRLIPRRIHGVECTVLLVGRLYKCQDGHEILGYDPDVLSQLHTMDVVPFRLWHKTGATEELISLVQSMLSTGYTINSITTMLVQRRYSAYAKKIGIVRKSVPASTELSLPTFEEWSSHSPSIGPSRHFVSACFLMRFWERENLFCEHMKQISILDSDSWLSCDHTFSSAGELLLLMCS